MLPLNEYYFKLTDEGGTPAPTSNNDGVAVLVNVSFSLTMNEVTT